MLMVTHTASTRTSFLNILDICNKDLTSRNLCNMSPEEEKGCDIVHSVQQTISCNSSQAIAPQASFEADLLSSVQLRWSPCTEPEVTSQNKTATDLKRPDQCTEAAVQPSDKTRKRFATTTVLRWLLVDVTLVNTHRFVRVLTWSLI